MGVSSLLGCRRRSLGLLVWCAVLVLDGSSLGWSSISLVLMGMAAQGEKVKGECVLHMRRGVGLDSCPLLC